MSKFTLTGKIIYVGDEQQITESLTKREFAIETDEQYPQQVKFELTKDKTKVVKPNNMGATVTVDFYVKGRAWKDKYFVNLQAVWVKFGEDENSPIDNANKEANVQPAKAEGEDDLPF